MTIKQGVVAGTILLLSSLAGLPARPESLILAVPEMVNLDLPPEDILEPGELQLAEDARRAIVFPEQVHSLLLKVLPDREGHEAIGALAILYPDVFQRGHPKTAAALRAEAAALHAILNPVKDLVAFPTQN